MKKRITSCWRRTCLLARFLLLALALTILHGSLHAQTPAREIKGKITDKSGSAMEGVTIRLKNGTAKALSTKDGSYTIKVPASVKQPVLQFSFVGYEDQEVTASFTAPVNVSLQSLTNSLDDVVVIGYGSVKRKDLTGSVGQVPVAELQKAPVASVDAALAGRVAGVQVTSPDGQPGSNADIVIRGVGSISQSSAPLYVVDGFPMEDANFNSINPADIETMEVLKDASATAIYGARGSNGVIIITTKKGKVPKPVVTYNGSLGTQKPTKTMQLLSPYEFVRLQNDINPYFANYVYFSNGKTLDDYKNTPAIDWQKITFNPSPIFQNHHIALTGRSGKTAYSLSASYTDQQGLIVQSGFRRFQTRFSLDQDVSNKVRVGVNVNFATTRSYGQTPSVQNVPVGQTVSNNYWNFMYNVWAFRPVQSSRANISDSSFIFETLVDNNIDEGGAPGTNTVNPYITATNEINDRINNTITANGYLQWQVTKDIQFRTTAGVNYITNETDVFHNSKTNSGSPATTFGAVYGPNGSITNLNTYSFLNENTLSWNKRFNSNHQVNAVVGFTTQIYNNRSNSFTATNVVNENLGVNGLGSGVPYANSTGASVWGLQSFLGRVNYTFKSNYLFTASFRADASSKFYTTNRWGYFPSGAFAWRLSNEKFMRGFKFIDDAKVRLSYGGTGNNRVGDFAYAALLTSNAGSNLSGSYYSFNEANVYNIVVSQIANRNLKWETGYQTDAGIDLTLFNNRLDFTFDYYKKVTKNLLVNASIPYSTGVSNAYENVGSVSNQGLEFSFTTTNITNKNFRWTTSFNISFNRNKVLSLVAGQNALFSAKNIGQQMTQFDYVAKVGQPIAQFYGFIADGMYQLNDFYKLPNGSTGNYFYVLKDGIPYYGTKSTLSGVNTTISAATSVQPGDPKYKDLNGDGVLDANDYTTIGNPYPKHFGGLNNNFTWKGFDLSIFLQWSYGNQVLNANRIAMEGGTSAPQAGSSTTTNLGMVNTNQFATYANRWTPTNPSNLYPRANAFASGTRQYSTRVVEDGSYIRLKTLQLGYTLPAKLLRRAGLTTARVYVAAQNLWTITGYSGPDPEVSTANNNVLTPGYDYSPYPRTKVMTVGVTISL